MSWRSRYNPLGIQMLPDNLYKQVFGTETTDDIWRLSQPSSYDLQKCLQHLKRHDLLPKEDDEIDTIYELNKHLSNPLSELRTRIATHEDIRMDIPKLEGVNIDRHFRKLGKKYSATYKKMALDLIENSEKMIQSMPREWSDEAGWTRYEPQESGGYKIDRVKTPLEPNLIFDVEICMNSDLKNAPTLAVAMSPKAWYSWTSPRLFDSDKQESKPHITTEDLIPFESSAKKEKLLVGHNVSFDRSYLSDQYSLQASRTRFLDTLSLHMCICGLTGLQRALKTAHKRKLKDEQEPVEIEAEHSWVESGSLNNLADVYQFHCKSTISKDARDIFVKGSLSDVRDEFQSLMTYCANDVKATFEVFKVLFAKYTDRFPHPVTLAGMLEMSNMYLPVNVHNWQQYIQKSQATYDEYEQRLGKSLQHLAKRACSMPEEDYSKDLWLWDADWSKQQIKPSRGKYEKWLKENKETIEKQLPIGRQVQLIYDTKAFQRAIDPFLPGFPKWYKDLCCPFNKAESMLGDREWQPGPILISTQMRITPKIMQLTWNGYPLHYNQKYGWGYLVPDDDFIAKYAELPEDHPYAKFPTEQLQNFCRNLSKSHILMQDAASSTTDKSHDDLVHQRINELRDNTQLGTLNLIRLMKRLYRRKKITPKYKSEYCADVEIPGAYFIRIPHKQGSAFNVGNPLSKDFISRLEDGTLSSSDNDLAKMYLTHSMSLSYWKNNHKRIKGQMVVPIDRDATGLGAILPRVIVAGTVTRRAVEPTWLTASNQDTSRIGSELKAMIQAPSGYSFVGADVDSQELWIASLMGDSYSYKIHGGTGLSYMTLRGSKSNNTDMHSKTASLIGITRGDAKVLNYARIYGAGQKFIERFLINTNNQMSAAEAKLKANTIFKETKGIRRYFKSTMSMNSNKSQQKSDITSTQSIPVQICKEDDQDQTSYDYETDNLLKKKTSNRNDVRVYWEGGTESATFNKLEEIASSNEPRTPVLECQISQALEPAQDVAQDFVTSRVNWVVQSSAVDFLHLVLVNMRWLFEKLEIDGRFSISIHDEVRYLVKDEDKYKAAFALQVSNLLVRAYFAYKLNMRDLPISVAFFSSVEIDKCLRKEVDAECRSPSNPYGMRETHGIPNGESLDIKQTLAKYTYKVE